MKIRYITSGIAFVAACLLSSQASAMTINDPGIVGTVEAGTQNASVANETPWANYLLSMGASETATFDANVPTDGATEYYQTSNTDYNGILTGGLRIDSNPDQYSIAGYEYVFAKYDGQNAGYVLFNVADYYNATGSYYVPADSASIWTNTQDNGYGLSGITLFNATVPEPGTLLLLGAGIAGIGLTRKKKQA